MSAPPTIVVGIPGKWSDRSAIVESFARSECGHIFAGGILMNIETKWSCQLEIYDHDPELREAFQAAGGGRIDDAMLDDIDEHTFTLYLSHPGGSFESASELMAAVTAVLDSGGMAVKVESSGIAHAANIWRELAATESPLDLMTAFVTYVGGGGEYYTCGMHNLGLPDTHVLADIAPNDAANLMHTLNCYVAFENPDIKDGQTFSVDADSPHYRIQKQACEMFDLDDLFHNPFGHWALTPA